MRHRKGPLEIRSAYVAKPDVLDLPLGLSNSTSDPSDSSSGTAGSTACSWYRRMQSTRRRRRLPSQADPQVLGPAVAGPAAWAPGGSSPLGRDHDLSVRVQNFGEYSLAHLRAVRVGGVEEVDLELARPAHESAGGSRVAWLTPRPMARHLHSPESEAPDGQIPTEVDRLGDVQRGPLAPAAYAGRDVKSPGIVRRISLTSFSIDQEVT